MPPTKKYNIFNREWTMIELLAEYKLRNPDTPILQHTMWHRVNKVVAGTKKPETLFDPKHDHSANAKNWEGIPAGDLSVMERKHRLNAILDATDIDVELMGIPERGRYVPDHGSNFFVGECG